MVALQQRGPHPVIASGVHCSSQYAVQRGGGLVLPPPHYSPYISLIQRASVTIPGPLMGRREKRSGTWPQRVRVTFLDHFNRCGVFLRLSREAAFQRIAQGCDASVVRQIRPSLWAAAAGRRMRRPWLFMRRLTLLKRALASFSRQNL